MEATALIAEDEPLLAANLQAELRRLWPALKIVASVGHGAAAVTQTLAVRPDMLFLDIRMPGMTGLEAAQALAEDWPEDAQDDFPLLVFVTAYDQYALQAFDRAAVDYVLKPVQTDRLAQTCNRLQVALAQRRKSRAASPTEHAEALQAAVAQLQGLVRSVGAGTATDPDAATSGPGGVKVNPAPLRVIQASHGNTVHMVAVDDVIYFEAADKYVRVVTAEREHLIRISLRELQPQLDASRFWQIHRGTLVRADAIATAVRDDSGRVSLRLKHHPDILSVSRMYVHLFKPM